MASATIAIQSIHILVIAFFVTGPYLSFKPDLHIQHPLIHRLGFNQGITPTDLLYIASSVGLLLHWMMNSDICILTQVEALLRGKKAEDSFLKRLIRPIYIITDQNLKRASYAIILGNLFYIFFYKYRNQPVIDGTVESH